MANRLFGNGIAVTLYERTPRGTTGSEPPVDLFNKPLYNEQAVTVNNVLVAPVSSTEDIDRTDLFGKQAVYVLGIPKGDTHNWEDSRIEFFGQTFHSFKETLQGIDDLIPGPWNKKVWVEIIE